tara:strand:+ start:3808 stop:4392 length:585 start_codon:yes stop_codon:yes gene_type:complete
MNTSDHSQKDWAANMFWENETRIRKEEFDYPDHIDLDVLEALAETRDIIAKTMYFTYLTKGPLRSLRHPMGDAVDPHSNSHAGFSLHKWGIDHSRSKEENAIIENTFSKAKAFDWDCNSNSDDELFEVYLLLAQKTRWTGIGVYPFWNNKGFHTDMRDVDHPSFNAHWFRMKDGSYHRLTWPNWKREIIGYSSR